MGLCLPVRTEQVVARKDTRPRQNYFETVSGGQTALPGGQAGGRGG